MTMPRSGLFLSRLLLLLLLTAAPWPTLAEETTANRAMLVRMQKLVDSIKTMEADFVQTAQGQGQDGQESRGHFSAMRPGRFRWDYRIPAEQLIVSDGQVVWYYEPDLKQATRANADRIRETPAGFFSSGGPIEETFTWETVADSRWPGPTLRLRPKKEGSVREIQVAMDPQRDRILGLEVVDNLGTRSHIVFDNMIQNKPIPMERFNFDPPAGVDVVEDTQGGH